MTAARGWAKQILELSPMSIRASKEAVYKGLDEPSLAARHRRSGPLPGRRRHVQKRRLRRRAAGLRREAAAAVERRVALRQRILGRKFFEGFVTNLLRRSVMGLFTKPRSCEHTNRTLLRGSQKASRSPRPPKERADHMSPRASTKAVGSDRGGNPSSCLPPVAVPVRKALT